MDYFDSCLILIPVAILLGIIYIIAKKKKRTVLWSFIFKLFFVIYLITLFNILFLPIPISMRAVETQKMIFGHDNNFYSIIPFQSTIEFLKHNASFDFIIQVGGNIALFIPMGFFLAINYIKQHQFIRILVITSIVAFCIEIIQLSISLAFRYPFRYADIDDVIFNAIGALVGILCYRFTLPILKRVMEDNGNRPSNNKSYNSMHLQNK